ncbi:MAG: ATP-dependent DNA helicase RecG [Proteobacteria bacterium]|nr:ATP-dependent DNA helicase RecG [Pseudomonadota bacterium]
MTAGTNAQLSSARSLPVEAATTSLPGIGPTLAQKLAERAIHTVEDLVWLVPRRYDDARNIAPLGQVIDRIRREAAGDDSGARVTCAGQVLSCRFHRRGSRRWIELRLGDTEAPPAGGQAAQIIIRWFNAHPNMAKKMARESRLSVSGRVVRRGHHAEMANPDILELISPAGRVLQRAATIIPRYSDIAGVPAAKLRRARSAAIDRVDGGLVEGVPQSVCAELGLVSLRDAVISLHSPPDSLSIEEVALLNQGKSEWHRRLVFEEFFVLGLAIARRRKARTAEKALPCPCPPDRDSALAGALPFALTGGQKRAIAAISADLTGTVPMNRLLQGDVGSGKTAVAFAAAHQAVSAGRQVAFMAPTELLAEQHFGTLDRWCSALGIRAALLTASTPKSARRSLFRAMDTGYLQLAVGTHALLSEGVQLPGLGLVIVDEQHRFGVAQRVELRQKSAAATPHLLVMTATPIPRTLALTAYGDLDVTVIDEMPPGRTPSVTLVLSGVTGRERAHALVRQCLARKERVFVVCPLIEPGQDEIRKDWADATSTAARLASTFAPARVGLVHGRMAQADRDGVMQEFRSGGLDILVATTVVEVGVDVPEATVMVILDAHHFGLAQLHQLRGRVGRGGGPSHCLLMTRKSTTPEGQRRLAAMAEISDGFRIAEEDLAIRGPGELLGVRQAGLPALRFGDLRQHGELLVKARDAAERVLADDPELSRPEHAMTRRALHTRTAGLAIYGAESG